MSVVRLPFRVFSAVRRRGWKKVEQSGWMQHLQVKCRDARRNRMQWPNLRLCLAMLLLLPSWFAMAQSKRVDDNALKDAAKNGAEWLTYGRDYAETHYSPLKQLTTENVKRLGLAWSWDTQSPMGGRIE